MSKVFKDCCRFCLSRDGEILDLYSLPDVSEGVNFYSFISKITGVQIREDEAFAKSICRNCEVRVKDIYAFCEMCIKSDEVLRNNNAQDESQKIKEVVLADDQKDVNKSSDENYVGCDSNIDDFEDSYNLPLDNSETGKTFNVARTKKYKCSVCSELFSNKKKYQQHETVHDNSKPFRCDQCQQTFSKEKDLNVHQRSHVKDEDKSFKCKICGVAFTYDYLLKQHNFKHSKKKPYPCSKCDKGCLTAESLKRHMKIHDENYIKKAHICSICNKEFAYPSFLAEHMKNHTGEKPFLCNICGKRFRQSGALHFHQRIHEGIRPFKCQLCGNAFRSMSALCVHNRKHTNEKPYTCKDCGRAFSRSSDLKVHSKLHSDREKLQCNICGKMMSTRGQLKIHVRTHTGEKPVNCSICLKSFITRSVLQKHERTHSDQRPFICDVCGRSFCQNRGLKKHILTHLKTSRNVSEIITDKSDCIAKWEQSSPKVIIEVQELNYEERYSSTERKTPNSTD